MDKWFGWHHEKAHRIQPMKKRFPSSQAVAPSKSNQTSNPVFAITIDRSIIASDTSVKVSALQPWLRRTVI